MIKNLLILLAALIVTCSAVIAYGFLKVWYKEVPTDTNELSIQTNNFTIGTKNTLTAELTLPWYITLKGSTVISSSKHLSTYENSLVTKLTKYGNGQNTWSLSFDFTAIKAMQYDTAHFTLSPQLSQYSFSQNKAVEAIEIKAPKFSATSLSAKLTGPPSFLKLDDFNAFQEPKVITKKENYRLYLYVILSLLALVLILKLIFVKKTSRLKEVPFKETLLLKLKDLKELPQQEQIPLLHEILQDFLAVHENLPFAYTTDTDSLRKDLSINNHFNERQITFLESFYSWNEKLRFVPTPLELEETTTYLEKTESFILERFQNSEEK